MVNINRLWVANFDRLLTHGISIQSFHVYLPDLPTWVTVTFWTSPLYASLSAMRASLSGSCPSGYVFAIASSLPHLTMCDLQVAFGFVGNYAPLDFHHRLTTCPSYIKRCSPLRRHLFIGICFKYF